MMDSIQSEVYTALQGTGYSVSYAYPQEGVSLPCVSFYEANNREFAQADGNEYLTEVEYTIDIWASTPETTGAMALVIDDSLAALRLKRTFSHDLYETDSKIHHKNMRYRAIIQGQTIHQ
jgi:hypothetical protein